MCHSRLPAVWIPRWVRVRVRVRVRVSRQGVRRVLHPLSKPMVRTLCCQVRNDRASSASSMPHFGQASFWLCDGVYNATGFKGVRQSVGNLFMGMSLAAP